MLGLLQALLQCQQIGLEGLRLVIAMVQIRLEGELPHVMQGDLCAALLGAAGILPGQGMAEAVGFGVAVDDKQLGCHGVAPDEVSPHYTPCPMGQSQATLCARPASPCSACGSGSLWPGAP
ncbi:hypothetical protein D3C72_1114130 [compost metagenome]